MSYAVRTSVPVERTRIEIEAILARYGADRFAYATEAKRAIVGFQIKDTTGTTLMVQMTLPLPQRGDRGCGSENSHAQAQRSRWRSLFLIIKAKLEACASGISTIEREFLADVMIPGGGTVGAWLRPQLADMSKNGKMPPLLMAGAST